MPERRREPDDVVSPFGPINNPVDRFAHLPEPTRKWLESLREEDLKDIVEATQMMHRAKIIGKFGKWTLATVVVALITGVAAGKAIQDIWGWIARGVRP